MGLVCASAALVSAAVPPSPLGALAWVALVPLAFAVHGASPHGTGQGPAAAMASGALYGALSAAGMHYWLWGLSAFSALDAIALAFYLALFPAVWCAAMAWLRARGSSWVFAGACLWTVLAVAREHLDFLSVPWEPLSQAQAANTRLLQIASLGGAPLVTFMVCLANLALAQAVRTRNARELAGVVALVTAAHGWGAWRIAQAKGGRSFAVGIVQPAAEPASTTDDLVGLRELTLGAAAQHAELVVWPESAVRAYSFNPALAGAIADIAHDTNTPILFGSADFGKYAEGATLADDPVVDGQVQLKNQALLVLPDGSSLGPYVKNRLVPFAEMTPLASHVTWPRWLVTHQGHGIAGSAPGLFQLPRGQTVGILICWENLFADLASRLVRGGASAIVQLTNDSDFRGGAEPAQHNAASLFRSVETERPTIVASSSGPSLAIDAYGRVLRVLGPTGARGAMVVYMNTASGSTVYLRFGLLWLWLGASVALGIVGAPFGWRVITGGNRR